MRHGFLVSGVFTASLIPAAQGSPAVAARVQDPGTAVAAAAAPQATEPAAVPETAEEAAFLDRVVCRAAPRAASRLRSRARVCDTRRAWRDLDEAAAAETRRLQNMGQDGPREDPLGRPE